MTTSSRPQRPDRPFALLLLVLGLLLAFPARQAAHDIPADVTVRAFVKPEGQRLRLLVRVPLEALSDMAFPTIGPGFLDFELARERNQFEDAAMVWMGQEVQIFENDVRLEWPEVTAIKISLPSDPSFETYETALAHVQGPLLAAGTQLPWQQAVLDVLFDYDIQSDQSDFSIQPSLERMGLQVTTVLRFLAPDTPERAFELHGAPGLVRLDPRWHQAAFRFVAMGFEHILDGIDHLLFVLALMILIEGHRRLIGAITAFTIAHSITLGIASLGFVHFPQKPVEAVIALSIVFLAVEISRDPDQQPSITKRRPWIAAFAFGLLHGFGFAGALSEVGLPGHAIPIALLCFNVGVELGQLIFIAVAMVCLGIVVRLAPKFWQGLARVPIYGIGVVSMFWRIERVAGFV